MNKIIIISAAIVAGVIAASADTNEAVTAEAVIAEAMKVIRDEGWTAADVADAIRSVRELYVRDNATSEGRARWNGKIVGSPIVDTNAMTKTTVYENGRVFVDQAVVRPPAESVAKSNAKLKTTVTTNGIPKALAEARLRRQAEKDLGVSNVTVAVTAGK